MTEHAHTHTHTHTHTLSLSLSLSVLTINYISRGRMNVLGGHSQGEKSY